MTLAPDKVTVLGEISERARELEVGGPAHHPDGTARPGDAGLAEWERRVVAEMRIAGTLTWRHELYEALSTAYAAAEWAELRDALVSIGAEVLNWIIDGDRRQAER